MVREEGFFMSRQAIQVATVILAGGQGTRLHPLTLHHSKPAVSYGGRYRLIDIPISNSIGKTSEPTLSWLISNQRASRCSVS